MKMILVISDGEGLRMVRGRAALLTLLFATSCVSAALSSTTLAQDEQPEVVDVDYSEILGPDWNIDGGITYRWAGDGPLTRLNFYDGPDGARIRVVESVGFSMSNGEGFYEDRLDDMELGGSALLPDPLGSELEVPVGCALADSVQGVERLAWLRMGSSMCLTDDGRFLQVTVEGVWSDPDKRVVAQNEFSAASSELVERLLAPEEAD